MVFQNLKKKKIAKNNEEEKKIKIIKINQKKKSISKINNEQKRTNYLFCEPKIIEAKPKTYNIPEFSTLDENVQDFLSKEFKIVNKENAYDPKVNVEEPNGCLKEEYKNSDIFDILNIMVDGVFEDIMEEINR